MKRTIHLLVDSVAYVRGEVYQHQLHEALNERFNCVYHELNDLKKFTVGNDEVLFSALRLRELRRCISSVKDAVGDAHVIVQDYDPWVSFEDGSVHKGSYATIAQELNATFFVPSECWRDLIVNRGFRCEWAQIGMKPGYCDASPWKTRTNILEFRGSRYASRDRGFERLLGAGFPDPRVEGVIKPYPRFLEHLFTVGIWAHSETEPIIVDGVAMNRNWIWPKAIEVLARGCFLIRDRQPEAKNYVDDLPCAFLFDVEGDAKGLLEAILDMSEGEKDDRIAATVDAIRKRDYYRVLSTKIEEWYDGGR